MLVKAIAWAFIAGLLILTVVPASSRPPTGVDHNLEHFLAFAAAGVLFACAHRIPLASLLAYAVGFTLVLELLQIPLPTRHARFEDFVVNGLGAGFGAAVIAWLRKVARNKDAGETAPVDGQQS